MLDGIIAGSIAVFSVSGLIYIVIGMLIGILVGVLPGIGPSLGMALLIPFTYNMAPSDAMILLISVYVGAEYGGSITSILIAVPGNGAAAATVLDGYPMAKKGQAALALEISLAASCLGGLLGGICLLLFLDPLAALALRFGPPTYFAVAILALTSVGALGGMSPLLGLLSAAIGLGIATIGVDPITSVDRFTFGMAELDEGIPPMVAIIGLFAVAEMIDALQQKAAGGLGAPMVVFELVEGNFRRSLLLSRGDYGIFVNDPLSVFFLALSAVVVLWPFVAKLTRKSWRQAVR